MVTCSAIRARISAAVRCSSSTSAIPVGLLLLLLLLVLLLLVLLLLLLLLPPGRPE